MVYYILLQRSINFCCTYVYFQVCKEDVTIPTFHTSQVAVLETGANSKEPKASTSTAILSVEHPMTPVKTRKYSDLRSIRHLRHTLKETNKKLCQAKAENRRLKQLLLARPTKLLQEKITRRDHKIAKLKIDVTPARRPVTNISRRLVYREKSDEKKKAESLMVHRQKESTLIERVVELENIIHVPAEVTENTKITVKEGTLYLCI